HGPLEAPLLGAARRERDHRRDAIDAERRELLLEGDVVWIAGVEGEGDEALRRRDDALVAPDLTRRRARGDVPGGVGVDQEGPAGEAGGSPGRAEVVEPGELMRGGL